MDNTGNDTVITNGSATRSALSPGTVMVVQKPGFVRRAWHVLVAIKDGLVMLLLLLFFLALFAALTVRPNPATVKAGALLIELDGTLVEQKSEINPLAVLTSGSAPVHEYQLRDVVRAIEGAANDDDVKVVVLDLSRFLGGGQVSLTRVGEALDKVRAAKKPVYAFAQGYFNDGYQLAAHADEIWIDPMGGALFGGPGGSNLYYGDLLNKLDVTAHIYKVGTYKAAVEPFSRSSQSEPAKENARALYGALWSEWKAEVEKARPQAKIESVTGDPAAAVTAANGNLAQMALDNGLVDKIGSKIDFGRRVAEIAGFDENDVAGNYDHSNMDVWLAANAPARSGERIGVITVAGEIVDGDAGAGVAAGDRISDLLYDGLAKKDLKALVMRVDSPGGSALASEEIRVALNEYRKQKIPVVVSMGNVAASGGYWVSTAGDYIMAEPATITGSIGIFAVIPSFEKALAKYGINADGVTTSPLSGQPDIIGGLNSAFDTVTQQGIEYNYRKFVGLVAANRNKTPEQIDAIGQGRVWDGGTARQIGLIDGFGSFDQAMAKAAELARLGKDYYPVYLEKPQSGFAAFLNNMFAKPEEQSASRDVFGHIAMQRRMAMQQLMSDMQMLAEGQGVQARCMECAAALPPRADVRSSTDLSVWLAKLLS